MGVRRRATAVAIHHSREKPALDIFNRGRESRAFAFAFAFSFLLDSGSEPGMTGEALESSFAHTRPIVIPVQAPVRHSRERGNPPCLPSVIPDIFNRGRKSRAFAFSFFLDARSSPA